MLCRFVMMGVDIVIVVVAAAVVLFLLRGVFMCLLWLLGNSGCMEETRRMGFFQLAMLTSSRTASSHAVCRDVWLSFRIYFSRGGFSKFFGPSPRKHRLTVYRGL